MQGLSEREAAKKLREHGLNKLTGRKKVPALKILLDQFCDLLVIILLASTAVSAAMGELTEAITIALIIIINGVLGFIQEYRTEKTLEALKQLAAPAARVIRGGAARTIPAEELVPGDVIIVEAGDRIPADAVINKSNRLEVDESLLTGESIPVTKYDRNVTKTTKQSMVFMGTTVTSGNAIAMIEHTGMDTEMGRIAEMIQKVDDDKTPLQKKLDHLGRFIAAGCLGICFIVAAIGIVKGEPPLTMLIAGISLAVAAIPEGLPAIVTVSLALGVQRMLRRNALVRRLPAVETLGCATVICSDKTGTLTENRMTVRRIFIPGIEIQVDGRGYEPEGVFSSGGRRIDPSFFSSLVFTLEIACLCNNAKLVANRSGNDPHEWVVEGDPTEGALLAAAARAGITYSGLTSRYARCDEIPFSSERKMMTVICRGADGDIFAFSKGAPDILLDRCDRILTENGIKILDPDQKRSILKICDSMASQALRLIAVAYRRSIPGSYVKDSLEYSMVFTGVLGILDPPRKEAYDAVRKCIMAGIRPVMITGDHKLTACAIAGELGITSSGGRVMTGRDIDGMHTPRFEKLVDKTSVFARVSPKHKLMIVTALKKSGHVVAMTGDGVNDAPAVKEADIGVSMGISGTDVTREASSMILLDDNFATIVSAIEVGRVIYDNIRKFIRYMLACNIGEVLTMFAGSLLGIPIPLLPIQILWVNLVTDGLPAVALGLDPPGDNLMRRRPRGTSDTIFSNGLAGIIIFRGAIIGMCTLAAYIYDLALFDDIARARTAAFATLVATQLIHVFECKSETDGLFKIPLFNNKFLVISVAISMILMAGVLYIPFLQNIFKTVALSMQDWLIILIFSAIGPALSSFIRPKAFRCAAK